MISRSLLDWYHSRSLPDCSTSSKLQQLLLSTSSGISPLMSVCAGACMPLSWSILRITLVYTSAPQPALEPRDIMGSNHGLGTMKPIPFSLDTSKRQLMRGIPSPARACCVGRSDRVQICITSPVYCFWFLKQRSLISSGRCEQPGEIME